MMNILVPMNGSDKFFPEDDFVFPKFLYEIDGKPMIQQVHENLSTIHESRFIYVVPSHDCRSVNIDHVIWAMSGPSSTVIRVSQPTRGAVCTTLLALTPEYYDDALIIANGDQIFDCDLNSIIEDLRQFDAGVLTFDSIHPRWSYVSVDADGMVSAIAEKKPISRNAVAGFYYFSKAYDYVEGAKAALLKSYSLNGVFYTSYVLQQLILDGKKIKNIKIASNDFHSFYSPQKILDFQNRKKR